MYVLAMDITSGMVFLCVDIGFICKDAISITLFCFFFSLTYLDEFDYRCRLVNSFFLVSNVPNVG